MTFAETFLLNRKIPDNQPENSPLLRVDDLHVRFRSGHGTVAAVAGIALEIAAGEILALVGESGSGKSVTARALVGLAGQGADVEAKAIHLQGRDGATIDLARLRPDGWRHVRGREIGFVLQDALVSLDPLRTVGREIAEPILAHRLVPRAETGREVENLLKRAGVPEPQMRASQYPHELSGGLRQRALIASALAARPRLLIADEPTTALDVTVQKQVLSVFTQLAKDGFGVLLITHDLAVAAQVAHRVAVMQNGRVVETGPAKAILSDPKHSYTRRLLAAVPTAAKQRLSLTTAQPLAIRAKPDVRQGPLLEIRDVSVGFERTGGGRFQAVRGVSVAIGHGETLGIVGESGSGKTTLGRVALAIQRPDAGEVVFEGKPWSALAEAARRPLRKHIKTISQDPLSSFDPRFTVGRLIEQPLRLFTALDPAGRLDRSAELLSLVGLPREMLERRPTALSGGQRQRVSIAQALAAEPKLLICDEPVSALDVTTQAQVLDLLMELQARLGLSMLFISHDLGVIRHVSHRIAVMKDGEVLETAATEDVLGRPQHAYTRDLIAAVPVMP